ncbi:MAG: hypothetical protein HFE51_04940 [Clostridia bacterium]|nr:hypothetical protein [Clostridia bacterium]
MFQKIIRMWNNLLYRLGYERRAKEKQAIDPNVQKYDDIEHTNWLAMAVSKVANLVCTETTYEVVSDSVLAEPLQELCKDIENKRFEIVYAMLGTGDCYIFPTIQNNKPLYHTVLGESNVVIMETEGENITKAMVILDTYKPDKGNRVFFLIRIHDLDENGTLTLTYYTVDETGSPQTVDKWKDLTSTVTQLAGANHIGFGRYKSPVPNREHHTLYGVPMNFGCSEIEEKLRKYEEMTDTEFDNAESRTFADPRNLRIAAEDIKNPKNSAYEIPKGIIPLRMTEGISNEIATHSPDIRYDKYRAKIDDLLSDYERQMGLSPGILTENEAMATGTATAVRRSNQDTISFVDLVHNALDAGNVMTLEADAVFLNIRRDLWEYNSDYYDIFGDSSEQWQRLVEARNEGAISVERLTEWLFPKMTEEQIQEEIAKANLRNATNEQSAIERALMQ